MCVSLSPVSVNPSLHFSSRHVHHPMINLLCMYIIILLLCSLLTLQLYSSIHFSCRTLDFFNRYPEQQHHLSDTWSLHILHTSMYPRMHTVTSKINKIQLFVTEYHLSMLSIKRGIKILSSRSIWFSFHSAPSDKYSIVINQDAQPPSDQV